MITVNQTEVASKNTFAAVFDAEVCALGAPRQHPTFFGIAHFEHPHPRYPKTLFLADLVQRYARSERRANTPHVLALCISNTPIPGIQKHLFWPIVCRGMCVWSATPEPRSEFLALSISTGGTGVLGVGVRGRRKGRVVNPRVDHVQQLLATELPHVPKKTVRKYATSLVSHGYGATGALKEASVQDLVDAGMPKGRGAQADRGWDSDSATSGSESSSGSASGIGSGPEPGSVSDPSQ